MSEKGGAIFCLIITYVLFAFSNHQFNTKHTFGYINVHKPIKARTQEVHENVIRIH